MAAENAKFMEVAAGLWVGKVKRNGKAWLRRLCKV